MISHNFRGLFRRSFQHRETRCAILSRRAEDLEVAVSALRRGREELEGYIRIDPGFQYSLIPVKIGDAPEVVKSMAEASRRAGVGPMSAVAGVLADIAVEEMMRAGADVAIVEDGGEASIFSDEPVDIALQAGDARLSRRLGFRLEIFPVGVATSSALYSHALSFGESEAVTVFAENAGLADAAATAVGNLVRGSDENKAVEDAVEAGLSIHGVFGVFILYRGAVGLGGDLPEIIGVNPGEIVVREV